MAKDTYMAETKSILDLYPEYRVDIGIEVHVQLNTKSKIFCSSSNDQTETANSHICQICTGYPGTLPVLNKKVVEFAIKSALATESTIAQKSTFARKHYFYPDLPKDYQITQDKKPICSEGKVTITKEDGSEKVIRLIRIHMEEDAGKNIHAAGNESFVDFNRAGTPLLEIVSYPDIESTEEVRAYLKKVRALVQYLGISTGNMEEGSFRADTNISVRKKNDPNLGTRCELKNINSFKFISDAVEYEIERQIQLLENGEKVIQQTRLWDTKKRESRPMRSKEEAADYRYFQDPDLPIIEINEEWINRVQAKLPELPDAKRKRLQQSYGIKPYEADILIEDRELALYFEDAAKHTESKLLINWILRDIMGYLKEHKLHISNFKMSPNKLAALMNLMEDGVINNRAAQEVFEIVAANGLDPLQVVKDKGLEQIGDSKELEKIVKEIIEAHPKNVAAYKAGKNKLFGFFVGQAMQKTKGKGNPKIINELLQKYLA
jgi:aspartyl-tRNA(Asn)/glutamyl-tRNA(Gln) amidotransferase subunit B